MLHHRYGLMVLLCLGQKKAVSALPYSSAFHFCFFPVCGIQTSTLDRASASSCPYCLCTWPLLPADVYCQSGTFFFLCRVWIWPLCHVASPHLKNRLWGAKPSILPLLTFSTEVMHLALNNLLPSLAWSPALELPLSAPHLTPQVGLTPEKSPCSFQHFINWAWTENFENIHVMYVFVAGMNSMHWVYLSSMCKNCALWGTCFRVPVHYMACQVSRNPLLWRWCLSRRWFSVCAVVVCVSVCVRTCACTMQWSNALKAESEWCA